MPEPQPLSPEQLAKVREPCESCGRVLCEAIASDLRTTPRRLLATIDERDEHIAALKAIDDNRLRIIDAYRARIAAALKLCDGAAKFAKCPATDCTCYLREINALIELFRAALKPPQEKKPNAS